MVTYSVMMTFGFQYLIHAVITAFAYANFTTAARQLPVVRIFITTHRNAEALPFETQAKVRVPLSIGRQSAFAFKGVEHPLVVPNVEITKEL